MKILLGILFLVVLIGVLRLGELYTQLARYQRYWDKQNQVEISKDDIVYVAFGDSAAQGVGASSPDKGYVGLIGKEIADKSSKKVKIINLSKSGARIQDVLDTQLPKYESLKIANRQIVTIDIGANDVVRSDMKNFEKDMDMLMSKLPKGVVVADIPSFTGSRFARLEQKVEQGNKIIYALAKKHGVEVASIHKNVANNHGFRTFAADIFHPSDYGYRINWLAPFMEKLNNKL